MYQYIQVYKYSKCFCTLSNKKHVCLPISRAMFVYCSSVFRIVKGNKFYTVFIHFHAKTVSKVHFKLFKTIANVYSADGFFTYLQSSLIRFR